MAAGAVLVHALALDKQQTGGGTKMLPQAMQRPSKGPARGAKPDLPGGLWVQGVPARQVVPAREAQSGSQTRTEQPPGGAVLPERRGGDSDGWGFSFICDALFFKQEQKRKDPKAIDKMLTCITFA